MPQEIIQESKTPCKECKYMFISAFLVLIGFFVLNYLVRGPALTTNLPGVHNAEFSSTTAQ